MASFELEATCTLEVVTPAEETSEMELEIPAEKTSHTKGLTDEA